MKKFGHVVFLHQQQSGRVMSNEIQELQRIAHKWTVIFLEENLPNLSKVRGGNWWGKCVLYYFNDWQEKMVVAQNISKLGNVKIP